MKISVTRAPTFTKAMTASAVLAIAYLASASSLPSCSDTIAVLNSGGQCLQRQSLLHTASGWLALACLAAAVLLLTLKHKDRIPGWQAPLQQPPPQGPPAQEQAAGFCARCGTRIITGDRFCQGCGDPTGPR